MSLIDGQTEHGQLNSSSDHERLISEYNRLKHERESVNVEPRNKWLFWLSTGFKRMVGRVFNTDHERN